MNLHGQPQQNVSYRDWKKFNGDNIPSSLETYDILYEKINYGETIVDIGCGYGKTCFELIYKGYGQITGFDINDDGIKFAIGKLKQLPENLKNMCRFEIEDALETSYEDNSFDHGIMQAFMTTITTVEQRQVVLREARRIIKPSGGLYLAVFFQTWHIEKYMTKYEKGEKETGELGSFYAYNNKTGELQYMAHHYTERELTYLLLNAGFIIDHFNYETFTTRSGNKINGAVIYCK